MGRSVGDEGEITKEVRAQGLGWRKVDDFKLLVTMLHSGVVSSMVELLAFNQ